MGVTVKADDWVRSHDEVREVLRYAAIGATAIVEPVSPERPQDGQWTLVLDAAPHHAVSARDLYSLPILGEPLQRRAAELLAAAGEALRRARNVSAGT